MRRAGRAQYGGLDLRSLFWLSLVGGAIYFGITFVPPYVEAYQVKQVLREAASRAIRERDDDRIRAFVIERCKKIGSHSEIREGEEVTVPGVVLLSDQVYVNRDDMAKTIIIQVEYTRDINYPFTKKQRTLSFSPSIKDDLNPVVW